MSWLMLHPNRYRKVVVQQYWLSLHLLQYAQSSLASGTFGREEIRYSLGQYPSCLHLMISKFYLSMEKHNILVCVGIPCSKAIAEGIICQVEARCSSIVL